MKAKEAIAVIVRIALVIGSVMNCGLNPTNPDSFRWWPVDPLLLPEFRGIKNSFRSRRCQFVRSRYVVGVFVGVRSFRIALYCCYRIEYFHLFPFRFCFYLRPTLALIATPRFRGAELRSKLLNGFHPLKETVEKVFQLPFRDVSFPGNVADSTPIIA